MILKPCSRDRPGSTATYAPGRWWVYAWPCWDAGLSGWMNPAGCPKSKKIIVYVEIDRCAADAIGYVTGVKLGRRSLKFVDNGIMAATFVNLDSGQAVRIVSTEESRDVAARYAPDVDDKRLQQLQAYKVMPDDVLFDVERVVVDIPVQDMPGPSRFKVRYQECGQMVRDKKRGPYGRQNLVSVLRLRPLLPGDKESGKRLTQAETSMDP